MSKMREKKKSKGTQKSQKKARGKKIEEKESDRIMRAGNENDALG